MLLLIIVLSAGIYIQHKSKSKLEKQLQESEINLQNYKNNTILINHLSGKAQKNINSVHQKIKEYETQLHDLPKNNSSACPVPADRLLILREAIRESNNSTP